MKTYLDELRGQVRGAKRLQRKMKRMEYERAMLRDAVAWLVTLADQCGHGDDASVVRCTRLIGWDRWSKDDPRRRAFV